MESEKICRYVDRSQRVIRAAGPELGITMPRGMANFLKKKISKSSRGSRDRLLAPDNMGSECTRVKSEVRTCQSTNIDQNELLTVGC